MELFIGFKKKMFRIWNSLGITEATIEELFTDLLLNQKNIEEIEIENLECSISWYHWEDLIESDNYFESPILL